MKVGIESISFYVPHYFLDLKDLAIARGIDPQKFYRGLGQEKMSVPAPDEDIVTIGANAAWQAIQDIDPDSIDTLMFATESGIDQSKAASIYVHRLLGLKSSCKTFELKQACCSSTAGLLMALALVHQRPDKRVLLVAADVARYGLRTVGEPTQGAGAVAMVISANPKLVEIGPENGSYTQDVMDFWRPNYRDEALVDGKYSIKIYLKALSAAWKEYSEMSGRDFNGHDYFCYHLPFTRMAEKAHVQLSKIAQGRSSISNQIMEPVEPSLRYNRLVGNTYTASLYLALTSLLESEHDLTNSRIGLFGYGSGCLGIYFSGVVQSAYKKSLPITMHRRILDNRYQLSVDNYEEMYEHGLPIDGQEYSTKEHKTGLFRLCGIAEHKRVYERTPEGIQALATTRVDASQWLKTADPKKI